MPIADHIIEERVIPARHGGALTIKKGQVLRIVDIKGQQCGDLVCFNLADPSEKLSNQNTVLYNFTIYLKTGHSLFSNRSNEMMTIIDDTVGWHDIVAGSCSREYWIKRFGVYNHRDCRTNLAEAVKPWHIKPDEVPSTFNPFMYWEVKADGTVIPQVARSRAGDYIDLEAKMGLLIAISACPSDLSPTNGYDPTPLKLIVYEKYPGQTESKPTKGWERA